MTAEVFIEKNCRRKKELPRKRKISGGFRNFSAVWNEINVSLMDEGSIPPINDQIMKPFDCWFLPVSLFTVAIQQT